MLMLGMHFFFQPTFLDEERGAFLLILLEIRPGEESSTPSLLETFFWDNFT